MLIKKPFVLGKWIPDNAFHNQNALSVAKNVIGQGNGYRPIKALVGDGTALDGRCRGAMTFRLDDSATETLAATKQKIYRLGSSNSWSEIQDITMAPDAGSGFSSMTQFGSLAVITNGADAVRKWDFVAKPGTTSVLGGSPPAARYAATILDFLVLGHLDTEEDTIQWSSINDAEAWVVGTNLAGKQQFPDGGRITGLFGGERGVAFQERKIRIMTFLPGTPEIFQIDVISEERGCVAYQGAAQIGNIIFFLANDGFYSLQGSQVVPLGDEVVNGWFTDNSRRNALSRTVCSIDPLQKIVMWSFFSEDNNTANLEEETPDNTIIYHWPTGKWTYADFGVSARLSVSTTPFGLEDLDSIDDLDALTTSLDSGIYNAEVFGSSFGVFNSSDKLAQFTGDNLQADLQIKKLHLYAPERQLIEGVHPITDAPNVQVSLTGYEALHGTGTSTGYVYSETSGWVPFHDSKRMHDIDIRIPEGETWDYVNSFYLDAERDGDL